MPILPSFFREFREFAVKGNAVDLAVGIVIGAAFQRIVQSLVNDILMPPIGALTGGVDFANLFISLSREEVATLAEARERGIPTLNYGQFISEIISFMFVAFALFLVVKTMNKLRRGRRESASKG